MANPSKYSIKERLNLEELYQRFLALSPRGQILSGIGVALVVLLLIIMPVSCASSKLGKMEKQIANHEKNVSKVREKIREYQASQNRVKQLEKTIQPKAKIQLTTQLETLATKSGIGGQIDSLKEKQGSLGEDFEEVVVSVRMTKLPLSQLIEFLYEIEKNKTASLKIKRMQLKPRYDNRQLFDITFEVSTLVSI